MANDVGKFMFFYDASLPQVDKRVAWVSMEVELSKKFLIEVVIHWGIGSYIKIIPV